jgi:predicted GIY-YIG superfamily endonuclease
MFIPYVKGVSEKMKRIAERYNIRTVFQTKHTLRSMLVKTTPKRELQRMTHCVYNIPCECGRNYIGETGRPLSVRLREHKHILKEGLLDRSRLAQHAYDEDHKVDWEGAGILDFERNSYIRKYKEAAHMSWMGNAISQPSLEFPPIWISLISDEMKKVHTRKKRW